MTRAALRVLTCTILALGPALAAASDVRVAIGPSGRKVIVIEDHTQRARRLSAQLLPVPDVDLEPLIVRHSDDQNLDPRLVRALIQVESGYNLRALSNRGAMGLMQLMPATASLLNVRDPYDPDENLRGGTTYLRRMIDRFAGRLDLALSAYNAGPATVERHGGIPPFAETRDYVRRILRLYRGDDGGLAAASAPTVGRRKAYLTRGPNNRWLLTTALAGSR